MVMRFGPEAKRSIADTRKENSNEVREGAERACRPAKLSWSLVLVLRPHPSRQRCREGSGDVLGALPQLPGATRSKLVSNVQF